MHYNSAISSTVRKVPKMEQSVAKVAKVAQVGGRSGQIAQVEMAQPEVARPEVARPEVARPEVAQPEVARVEVADLGLARLAQHLTEPGERECLRCFLMRMIREFGCDGTHRWTIRWRDLRAPRARGLVGRMQRRGGGGCDCEVIFTVCPGYPETGSAAPCAGILRSGSAVPCDPRPLGKSA
jgi:hypothetical protein